MFTLTPELLEQINKAPLPEKVKKLIPDIYLETFLLLIKKEKKSPIEVMANELINSFLHTYVAPLV